jgi:hypothetical protein
MLDFIIGQEIIYDAPHEGDVSARSQRCIVVSYGGGACETRIHNDQFCMIVFLSFDYPLKTARMGFGGIAAHDQNQVGVLDVDPVVGHRATAVCGGQTGHRRAVSDPGLIIEGQNAQRTDHFVGQVTRFAA